jgi:hypothetical protein
MFAKEVGTVIERGRSNTEFVIEVIRRDREKRKVSLFVTSGTLRVGDKAYLSGGTCRKATIDEIGKYEQIEAKTVLKCEKRVRVEFNVSQ